MPEALVGIKCSVIMDVGRELPEYKTEMKWDSLSSIPLVTCYIPSEAGKTFQVKVEAPALHYQHWAFDLSLDDSSVVVPQSAMPASYGNVAVLSEDLVGPTSSRTFQFSNIQRTVEDRYLLQMMIPRNVSNRLGEIELRICSVDGFAMASSRESRAHRWSNAQSVGRIHERAKKAMDHCIDFGEPRFFRPGLWAIPFGKRHQATVIFKYRTIDLLVADNIAPRSVLPLPKHGIKYTPRTMMSCGTRPPRYNRASVSGGKRKLEIVEIELDSEGEELVFSETEEEIQLKARLAEIMAQKRSRRKRIKREPDDSTLPSTSLSREILDLTHLSD
ncbi:hypothetical protein CC1G_07825 [Coprinopsis cinerea okayama7|uniref:DUF7918 domain-containing protein n=1 Tax=Coprinopsis cinerea (strain Okayama-7 / 130 / ATCC MYA-4618 / FGSC 9003) TaxID=240176 RepID=A8P3Y3_COPC7|nr:hypothetical protein CC1G_07825 [Coprinopsis cinerea okayama7\|eukprot:XP_001838634.2 hypothetical protein CC1G_07825 [Coprinopsis cinerea okayama7\